jgi:hypothetical protein
MKAPCVSVREISECAFRLGDCHLPLGSLPLIITDLVDKWPATQKWTKSYLTKELGDQEVNCMVASVKSGSFLQQTNRRHSMRFDTFLEQVFDQADADSLYYLRIGTESPLFEALSGDFLIPELLDHYNPSATGIWMGQRGNVTPFHHDWWHSFLAQISGKKAYTIVHPMDSKNLQTGWPVESYYDLKEAPVLQSSASSLQEVEVYMEGILEPGQILYIPPYWYHQIETLENGNISMPIRFDTRQSADVPLFQFSQDSVLRPLTNHPVDSESTLLEVLKENRLKFQQREEAFVQAFCKVRNPSISPRQVLKLLDSGHP